MKYFFYDLYKWVIAFPILIILTITVALLNVFGCILNNKWWGYYPAHFWAKCWCRLLFVKVIVNGRENIDSNTSYVFISNHQGAFDIFTVYGYLNHNFKWMMKKSLKNIPFVGAACVSAGHIMVDRSSARAIIQTMNDAKKRLRDGMSLVIFPEGARTWNGKMRPFKKGAFKLATDFRLPIVPLTIDGAFDVLPRTSITHIRPATIKLTIHKPIYPNGRSFDIDTVMHDSFNTIQSALPAENRIDVDNYYNNKW